MPGEVSDHPRQNGLPRAKHGLFVLCPRHFRAALPSTATVA